MREAASKATKISSLHADARESDVPCQKYWLCNGNLESVMQRGKGRTVDKSASPFERATARMKAASNNALVILHGVAPSQE